MQNVLLSTVSWVHDAPGRVRDQIRMADVFFPEISFWERIFDGNILMPDISGCFYIDCSKHPLVILNFSGLAHCSVPRQVPGFAATLTMILYGRGEDVSRANQNLRHCRLLFEKLCCLNFTFTPWVMAKLETVGNGCELLSQRWNILHWLMLSKEQILFTSVNIE